MIETSKCPQAVESYHHVHYRGEQPESHNQSHDRHTGSHARHMTGSPMG